jgi:hypothetical protein
MKATRVFKVNLIVWAVLLVLMLVLSRQDARPADGALTQGFPLTFYTDLQNEACLGDPLPDGTCCIDKCPPEFSAANLAVDAGVTYAASLVLALAFILLKRS